MSEKLKPCPFCGGNNLSVKGVTVYWVECNDCNAASSVHKTEEEAIEAWNRMQRMSDYTDKAILKEQMIKYGFTAPDMTVTEFVEDIVPSAEPECNLDEWCHNCKEYYHDKHRCPRWNRVIRTALEEAQPERKRGK
jgi:Lar family restriction alleviation protein